ncbi:MAG: TatD family hydrolase [Candidatus Paceibacterota bacterium]|jgi:TatD DNase family protein
MEMKYIDIHSHLDFESYGTDRDAVLERMKNAGVATITIGTGLESSKEAVKIAEANGNVWACIGAHPDDNSGEVFDEKEYEKLVKSPKVVAIGECGLDYAEPRGLDADNRGIRKTEAEKSRQKAEFEKHILFAIKYKKPLMLHIREAYDDTYEILKKYEGKVFGNLHFFTSNLKTAENFIDLGFTISFPGIITYVRDFDKVIKTILLDKIHAETDSPFATPIPHRGERNEPAYVVEVYKKIAEIRGEDPERVRLQLLENSGRVFDVS